MRYPIYQVVEQIDTPAGRKPYRIFETFLHAEGPRTRVLGGMWEYLVDAKKEVARLEALSSPIRGRVMEALADSDTLICAAQEILADYLPPDGITQEEAIDRLLGLLDGPRQREVQAATRTILNARACVGDFDITVDGVKLETVEFWFVWTKTGHLPRHAHQSEVAAMREAARLAKKHPGKKFIVLRAEHKLHVPSTIQPVKEAA